MTVARLPPPPTLAADRAALVPRLRAVAAELRRVPGVEASHCDDAADSITHGRRAGRGAVYLDAAEVLQHATAALRAAAALATATAAGLHGAPGDAHHPDDAAREALLLVRAAFGPGAPLDAVALLARLPAAQLLPGATEADAVTSTARTRGLRVCDREAVAARCAAALAGLRNHRGGLGVALTNARANVARSTTPERDATVAADLCDAVAAHLRRFAGCASRGAATPALLDEVRADTATALGVLAGEGGPFATALDPGAKTLAPPPRVAL